jgi:hypothetical protein
MPCLMAVIQAAQETEIRRISVQGQPEQIVCEILSQKYPAQNQGRWNGSSGKAPT